MLGVLYTARARYDEPHRQVERGATLGLPWAQGWTLGPRQGAGIGWPAAIFTLVGGDFGHSRWG